MKKISFKLTIPVVILILIMSTVLVGLSINRSSKNIESEARDKLKMMAGQYANEFNSQLESIDSTVNSIQSLIESTIELDRLSEPDYMEEYKEQVAPTIKRITETTPGILGAYIFFNPGIINEAHDIYFADDGKGNFVKQPELGIEDYDESSEDMSWFYEPYRTGTQVWTNPFYWESLDIYMFSHATAVIIDGNFIGTVGIDIKFDDIKSTVDEIQPYETGFAYLVNDNTEFLVHPEYNVEDSLKSLGFDKEAEQMINNDSGIFIMRDQGKDLYNGYKRMTNGWIMGVTAPDEEVLSGVNQMRNFLIIAAIITIIIAASIMFILGNKIAGPVVELSNQVDIFGNGDLTVEFKQHSDDEIGQMENSLKKMSLKLRDIIENITGMSQNMAASSEELSASGDEVGRSAEQVGSAIQDVASGAEEQSAQMDETKGNVEELITQINRIGEMSTEMNEQAENVMDNIEEGNSSVSTSVSKVNNVKKNSAEISEEINSLGKLSNEIGDIIELINGISNQTNLLALNAAIEAARAGEAGRGFSVVADEIRALAEDSTSATEKIGRLIEEIQKGVKKAVSTMDDTEEVVDESVNAIEETGHSFKEIDGAAKQLKGLIKGITDRAKEMAVNSDRVESAVNDMAAVSQQAAGNAEEVAASSEEQIAATEEIVSGARELADMADELSEAVNKFKL